MPSSFACRLVSASRRFVSPAVSSLRLVLRCLASRMVGRVLLVSSWSCRSRGVARGAVESCRACPSHLIALLVSSGGASCPSRRGISSRRLVERGGFGFSFYPDGERRGCGSRPAVPGPVLACLGAVGEWGDAVLVIGVLSCSLLSYGCGGVARAVLMFGSSSPASCSWGHRSCLVPLIRFDETRREAGRLAAWLSWLGPSWLGDECI